MPLRLDAQAPGFADAFRRFVDAPRGAEAEVDAAVAEIIADVRQRGDAAVIACTARFDRVRLTAERLRIDAAALARIGPAAITLARAEGLEAHALSVALRLDRRS